jgi:hypothetical protein
MKKRKKQSNQYLKIDTAKLGIAGGIITGLCIALTTLATAFWGLFPSSTGIIIDVYGFLGFTPTIVGALLGTVYGFIDGFIAFWVLGVIYNKLLN